MEADSTKLGTKKLQQNIPVNAATIQKKSSTADLIIGILSVLLVIVIGIIIYIQFFR